MKSKLVAVLAAAVGVLVFSGPMFGHHSQAIFDKDHPITLTGTVTKHLFINPHVQVHFEVKDASGNVVKWVAEAGNPASVYSRGWNKKSVQPGDQITVTGGPARNGRKFMSIGKLVAPNGKQLLTGSYRGSQ